MTSKYNGNDPRNFGEPGDEPFDQETEFLDAEFEDIEPLDAEIIDESGTHYEPETEYEQEAVEEYRGAHRRYDDDYDDADYDSADDAAYADDSDDAALAGAGAAGATAAGTTAAGAGSTAVASGGVPKRGLAMILIAVAALLLLWGIWAMTQNNDSGTNNAGSDNTGAPAPTSGAAEVPGDGQVGDGPSQSNANEQENPENPENPAPAPGEPLTAANAQVFVYNNSGVPDLAGTTAQQLDGQFNIANKSEDPYTMNMPEQQYGIFPETIVYYDPQVNGAEQLAAEVAAKVGGTPRVKGDIPAGAVGIPEEAANSRNSVTVVLAG